MTLCPKEEYPLPLNSPKYVRVIDDATKTIETWAKRRERVAFLTGYTMAGGTEEQARAALVRWLKEKDNA